MGVRNSDARLLLFTYHEHVCVLTSVQLTLAICADREPQILLELHDGGGLTRAGSEQSAASSRHPASDVIRKRAERNGTRS